MSYHHGPYHSHPTGPAPTHVYYNRGPSFMRRGPSRLVWFGLGGLATYWLINSRERRRELMSQGQDTQNTRSCASWGAGWGGWGEHQHKVRQAQYQAEEQQRRFQGLGTSASEAIVDLTESSLDSVMASVIALKSKLAEQRASNEVARASIEKESPRQV